MRAIVSFVFFATVFLIATDALAQALPPIIDPTGRSGEPKFPDKPRPFSPKEQSEMVLPPVQPLEPTPAPQDKGPVLRVFVKQIRVVGSTVFSEAELAQVTAPYENREITTEDLEEVRRAITLMYVNKGYANSGAVIPDQSITEGTVTIQVVEGTLSDINIEGNKWFRAAYLRDRIDLSTKPPFNLNPLKDRLQLLLQDSRLERVNAELKPGTLPGEAILDVKVQEANPIKAWVEFNNYQTPVVGAERGLATIQNQNLTGNGDTASFTYGQSRGVNPIIDTNYTIPLNRYDTTFFFGYRRNDFLVVEQPFKPLNIDSRSEIFTLSLRQPVYRTVTDEVALSLIGERLFNKTTLLGQSFDFVPGAQDGVATVSALRFAQEWTHRTQDSVFALRSRLSLGVDVLGATVNSKSESTAPLADGQFFSWLGQASWVKRFDSGVELLNRLDVQLANDKLFPLEQFAVGGRYSVRGYRENTLVRDNALLYSIEGRIPIWTSKDGWDIMQFAPFIDYGRGWNAKGGTPDPITLASVGAGLRFNIFNRANANIYWGQQLNHVRGGNGNLQDHGVHVQFVWNVL